MTKTNAKSLILDKYNLSASDFLGSGMEAEVYAYGNDKVLEFYNDRSDFNKQRILKRFYSLMDSGHLSYELPYIYDTFEEHDILVTIEKRIEGSNMQGILSEMDDTELNKLMETYLNAAIELKTVSIESDFEGLTLFNNMGIASSKINGWFDLLKEMILKKRGELAFYFNRDVVNFDAKFKRLLEFLSSEYKGEYSLIHGDFYPGNLLIDKNREVTGLIDFGWMTMYGDYLFDIAIGWACFDMYDELNANILERYLDIIISTLGEEVRERLYSYVLIYSIISANFYSHNCEDDHYQWCIKNLNNQHLWGQVPVTPE